MWRNHCEQLLNIRKSNSQTKPTPIDIQSMDRITVSDKLKLGKSPGHDGLIAEHFRHMNHLCYVVLYYYVCFLIVF